jgi:hypothetical protein
MSRSFASRARWEGDSNGRPLIPWKKSSQTRAQYEHQARHLLFPAGEEIFSVDLELKAIVEPDLTFRATMTSQTTGRRGGFGGLFCLGALQRDGGFRAALLCC